MRTFVMKGALSTLIFLCFSVLTLASDTIPTSQQNATYFLVFAARSPKIIPFSIGGHAFVTWGIKAGGDSIRSVHTYGFFPNEKAGLLAKITKKKPGHVVRGFFKNSSRQKIRQMVVAVDYETWKNTLAQTEKWDGKGYNLLKSNCLSFMDDMADQTNLKTPNTSASTGFPRTPSKYIKKMKACNKGKNQRNLHVYDPEDCVCADDYVIVEPEK